MLSLVGIAIFVSNLLISIFSGIGKEEINFFDPVQV